MESSDGQQIVEVGWTIDPVNITCGVRPGTGCPNPWK
jgi:hypothetical protein